MTIQYHQLSEADYKTKRYNTILQFEESGQVKLTAYRDSAGYPTIGAGFKIDSNWNTILDTLGFNTRDDAPAAEQTYTALLKNLIPENSNKKFTASEMTTLNEQLNTIMQARHDYYANRGDNTKRTTFSFNDATEVEATFQVIADEREKTLSKWLGETTQYSIVPMGNERVALLSLLYNNVIGFKDSTQTILKSPNLLNDIKNGDRLAAWYEISYHSNGGSSASQGIANRRYQEAYQFGLWDSGGPTATELANFETFLNSTDPYSTTKSKLQNMRDYEADYPPSNAGISTIDNYINGTPAIKNHFVNKYAPGAPIDGNVILGTELGNNVTDANMVLTKYGIKSGYLLSTDKNDLIFGEKGKWNTYGGRIRNGVRRTNRIINTTVRFLLLCSLSLFFLLFTIVIPAQSDFTNSFVKPDCIPELNFFRFSIINITNIDEIYRPFKGDDHVNKYLSDLKKKYNLYAEGPIAFSCKLPNYVIEAKLNYITSRNRGQCGARPGAEGEIIINGKRVIQNILFDNDCFISAYSFELHNDFVEICAKEYNQIRCINRKIDEIRVPLNINDIHRIFESGNIKSK